MGRANDRDEGLTAVAGTIIVILIAILISVTAWFMFNMLVEDQEVDHAVHVGFYSNSVDRSTQVIEFSQPLEWGVDLLVLGDCNPELNGNATIAGPVVAGDVLVCANAGELRIVTSEEIGGDLLYRITFQ